MKQLSSELAFLLQKIYCDLSVSSLLHFCLFMSEDKIFSMFIHQIINSFLPDVTKQNLVLN